MDTSVLVSIGRGRRRVASTNCGPAPGIVKRFRPNRRCCTTVISIRSRPLVVRIRRRFPFQCVQTIQNFKIYIVLIFQLSTIRIRPITPA